VFNNRVTYIKFFWLILILASYLNTILLAHPELCEVRGHADSTNGRNSNGS